MEDQQYELLSKINHHVSRIADSLEGISGKIDDLKATAVGPLIDLVTGCNSALNEIEQNTTQ